MTEVQERLEAFVQALESAVAKQGELVLGLVDLDLGGAVPEIDPENHHFGMSEQFAAIVDTLCPGRTEWHQLYGTFLIELGRPKSPFKKRIEKIFDKLWMTTTYGDLTVWHIAFPALDGGGSVHARGFQAYLKEHHRGRKFKTCFEWCCGPGFLGLTTLSAGLCEEVVLADINPQIVPGIQRTIRENGLEGQVRWYVSDNLKSVPGSEQFDLVMGNPPWAFREIPDLPNPLIPNDPGWRIHQGFFQHIGSYLTDDALLLVSCYEPFKSVAHIPGQAQAWDVRPRPPVLDFRHFMTEGGLYLERVAKPQPDPLDSTGPGTMFLVGRPVADSDPPWPELDLIGTGGLSPEKPEPEPFEFQLELFAQFDLPSLFQGYQRWQAFQAAVYANLETKHLTQVMGELFEKPSTQASEILEQAGIPKNISEAFCDWSDAKRFEFRTSLEQFQLATEGPSRPVESIRIQLTHDAPVCVALRLLRALCEKSSLKFLVLVKPGFGQQEFERLLASYPDYEPSRFSFWEHRHQTLFAQDNGKLGYQKDGSPALLVPDQLSQHRPADRLYGGPVSLLKSAFHWEGGNLLVDDQQIFVGANSVAASMRHLGLTEEQVVSAMAQEMGKPVAVLGMPKESLERIRRSERGMAVEHSLDGGQADFHIDLDCCLISGQGEKIVAVACPELGLDYLDDVLAKDELFLQHFLPPREARERYLRQVETSAARRSDILDRYESQLRDAGYRVVRVPDIRSVTDYNYLARVNLNYTYLNGFGYRSSDGPTLLLLPLGHARLEKDVEELYGAEGVQVRWVGDSTLGAELVGMRGGLHCFCSALS